MASKKAPKNSSRARQKPALRKETLKDLTPQDRQTKAVKGGFGMSATCGQAVPLPPRGAPVPRGPARISTACGTR